MHSGDILIKISKIDAAIEQLNCAIMLFFDGGNHAAVHTLSSAAHRIFFDISKSHNGNFAFESEVRIRPEFIKEWRKKTNAAANFFKHADVDPDPDGSFLFNEHINDMKILFCCIGMSEFRQEHTPFTSAFIKWMMCFKSNLFKLTDAEMRANEQLFREFGADSFDREKRLLIGKMLLAREVVSFKNEPE